ncbi:hypothetical protein AGABI1DRAFT_107414 [Agaricus bisporus var. burnettii JB137-S8]|uniref:Uncharacterized protein n=1 Tax=Agaricus bisporus var. burnettii (strain JB137-S8 / ATCC MYA-4627 / FGSC 10392) TaxID=597362 RepID=K5WU90_AGABU|nr:uncharacterized protein AGABI1DRAFT_107414 [Agaricus bisporus var. burnettii JB137-S8]EKM79011.1 hypothetical protein AGABI1DRAFT_107414 [Agaricus bisporus var. burnettii JB137-S8]
MSGDVTTESIGVFAQFDVIFRHRELGHRLLFYLDSQPVPTPPTLCHLRLDQESDVLRLCERALPLEYGYIPIHYYVLIVVTEFFQIGRLERWSSSEPLAEEPHHRGVKSAKSLAYYGFPLLSPGYLQ